MHARTRKKQLLAYLIIVAAGAVGCSDDDDGPGIGSEPTTAPERTSTTTPGGSAPDSESDVVLREVSSCGEAAEPLGSYLADFELYEEQVVPGDDRYSCEWRRPADPDGWDMAIILVGHYTNTPDFASNDWEMAGLTPIDDARVEPFGGLALLHEPGANRVVHVMGLRFDAQLQVVALRGQEPTLIPVDDAVGILLDLTTAS